MAGKHRLVDLDPEPGTRSWHRGEAPDSCPFARPFPIDFASCPVFEPDEFRTLDLRHQPAQPVLTCANLVVGTMRDGAHYGRCTLGGVSMLSAQDVTPTVAG